MAIEVTVIMVYEKQELVRPKSNRKIGVVIENHKRKGGGYNVHYESGEVYVDLGWSDTALYALMRARAAVEDIVEFWLTGEGELKP